MKVFRKYSKEEINTIRQEPWFKNFLELTKTASFNPPSEEKKGFYSDGFSGKNVLLRLRLPNISLFKMKDKMDRAGVAHNYLISLGYSERDAKTELRRAMKEHEVNFFSKNSLYSFYSSLITPQSFFKKVTTP